MKRALSLVLLSASCANFALAQDVKRTESPIAVRVVISRGLDLAIDGSYCYALNFTTNDKLSWLGERGGNQFAQANKIFDTFKQGDEGATAKVYRLSGEYARTLEKFWKSDKKSWTTEEISAIALINASVRTAMWNDLSEVATAAGTPGRTVAASVNVDPAKLLAEVRLPSTEASLGTPMATAQQLRRLANQLIVEYKAATPTPAGK